MEPEDQLKIVETYKVPELDTAMRLSDFVPGIFKTISSKKGMKNAIKKGLVKINGTAGYTSDYIKGGEIIELFQSTVPSKKPSITLPIEVLYEDDYLAIVSKPAGIVVSGNKKITLGNALLNSLKSSNQEDALIRPEPIHRLDYATSGALLIGKTSNTIIALNKLFEERKIEKKYYAVTIGSMTDSGTITTPIENKPSKSTFKVLNRLESSKYEFLNLVELIPHTGRRNQLRIHMAEIGNPIFGDQKFGKERLILLGKGLYLHSFSLGFIHPATNQKLIIKAPIPKKLLKLFPEILNNH